MSSKTHQLIGCRCFCTIMQLFQIEGLYIYIYIYTCQPGLQYTAKDELELLTLLSLLLDSWNYRYALPHTQFFPSQHYPSIHFQPPWLRVSTTSTVFCCSLVCYKCIGYLSCWSAKYLTKATQGFIWLVSLGYIVTVSQRIPSTVGQGQGCWWQA